MNNLFDPDGHVAQPTLSGFAAGDLNREELTAVAEHIAVCEQCAGALAEAVEVKPPASVPAGFEEAILNRISDSNEKRAELFHFSFRVALAACAALLLVFSSTLNAFAGSNLFAKIKAPDSCAIEIVNTHLRDFSQQILDMEVFHHAEKTK